MMRIAGTSSSTKIRSLGPTNARWNLHLGLVVDADDERRLTLRVGGETRSPWAEGAVVLFDDSFEHEVAHGGASDRIVLDVNVAHPDVAAPSRRGVRPGARRGELR